VPYVSVPFCSILLIGEFEHFQCIMDVLCRGERKEKEKLPMSQISLEARLLDSSISPTENTVLCKALNVRL
jgi:hypothetical protein